MMETAERTRPRSMCHCSLTSGSTDSYGDSDAQRALCVPPNRQAGHTSEREIKPVFDRWNDFNSSDVRLWHERELAHFEQAGSLDNNAAVCVHGTLRLLLLRGLTDTIVTCGRCVRGCSTKFATSWTISRKPRRCAAMSSPPGSTRGLRAISRHTMRACTRRLGRTRAKRRWWAL